jgi:hypothetical protein
MKFFLALFGTLVGFSAFAFAGWITVDNPTLGEKGGYAWTMARGPEGRVFVNATNGDSSLVRMGDASGTNWITADTFRLAPGMGAQPGPVAAWGNQVYAGFQLQDAQGIWHWIIRKSANKGAQLDHC